MGIEHNSTILNFPFCEIGMTNVLKNLHICINQH